MASKSKFSLPLRVGMVGCGAISNAYFDGLAPFGRYVQITACADLDLERARQKAAEKGVARACTVDELLADPEIDAVLNLTIPAAHAAINLRALKAGKHAYCEKPFALSYKEGLRVVQEARKRKLRVGCAPDTVLGSGVQTSRKLVDAGAVGPPVSATANMLIAGHESWHPSPEFYYKPGGGPLFDMGPYYLTTLVLLLGPVKSVLAVAKMTHKERTITSQPLHGKKIKVEVPTHLSGVLEFGKGVVATVTMSFDTPAHHLPMIEVYGTGGAIQGTDPNGFDGNVRVWTRTQDWDIIPPHHSLGLKRGIGLADMAAAIKARRPHRMSGELALHVLEVMESFHVAAKAGRKVTLKSTCQRPAPMPEGLAVGNVE